MSEQMILAVLNEALEELRVANKSLKEMGDTVKALETRVEAFEQKEIKIEPPDLEPLKEKIDQLPGIINGEMVRVDDHMGQRIVAQGAELRKETTTGMVKIAAVVEAQPKPVVHRISFFPENDWEGNYKAFIRWVIGGILGMFLIGATYVVFQEWIIRAYPRQASPAAPGMVIGAPLLPPTPTTPQVPGSGRRAGETGSRKNTKKAKKIFDTLNLNTIRRELDSLRGN